MHGMWPHKCNLEKFTSYVNMERKNIENQTEFLFYWYTSQIH